MHKKKILCIVLCNRKGVVSEDIIQRILYLNDKFTINILTNNVFLLRKQISLKIPIFERKSIMLISIFEVFIFQLLASRFIKVNHFKNIICFGTILSIIPIFSSFDRKIIIYGNTHPYQYGKIRNSKRNGSKRYETHQY